MINQHSDIGRARLPPQASARPGTRRRPRRRDPVRVIARVLCAVLALLGVAPVAATLVVRSAWARAWATRETERALAGQGIVATYEMALRVWPLAVELTRVRVESTDGGAPVVICDRVRVRPRLFGLLAGKLVIDQVELDAPRLRAVVRSGQLVNLPLRRTAAHDNRAFRSPLGTLSLTDASVDLDVDGVRLQARSVDLDVTTDDDAGGDGPSYEVALRAGQTVLERTRARTDGSAASDEDVLCSVDARVRWQPDGVVVRRLDGAGYVDLDGSAGTAPGCDLPESDERRLELSLGNVHVLFARAGGGWPAVDGHVTLRAPVALAERAADLPDVDGWLRVDADVRYERGSNLPEVAGTIDARDLRLGRYSFAQELHGDVTIRHDVLESREIRLRLAGGLVTLSDTVLAPLARGARLDRTRLDASGVDFTELLRALGVHKSPHVGWDIREVHAPAISGTLSPLRLDGDFSAKTASFGVYDRPASDRARVRLFGFSEAQIAAHFGARPDALRFTEVHATLPRSRVDGGVVSLGFNNEVRIDAPHISADLDDVSPIGPVAMHGKLEASGHVGGVFTRPEPEGDIHSITGFVAADMAFGDVSSGHVAVDIDKPEVEITGVRAKKRDSAYEVPTATLRFGGARGFVVDAVGSSGGFGLRDLLSMFALDDDPRFDGLDATFASRADVHVALGGPEDACGAGYVGVDVKGHLANVGVYGERFAQGDADVSLRWYDRRQGIAGADVDVRSFVLDKVRPPAGTRAGATGTLLGSALLRRGGALAANIMIEGVPLSRVDALGSFGQDVEGSVSGVAHVTGDLDDFHRDAGFVARAEFDVSGTRVRGVALPGSHLDVRMTHTFAQQQRVLGRTLCGAPVSPPFDKAAYLADASAHERWSVDGDLLGGTARLRDVVVTRSKAPELTGRLSLRGLDLGPLASAVGGRRPEGDEPIVAPARSALGGQLWGELVAEEVPLLHPSASRVTFLLGPTVVSRGGERLLLRPPRDPLVLAGDTLTVPPLEISL
ncbi:MAG TPA: hypothetical protein VE987_21525, partial [Polyangiaceae bacterium]|nr:hypothetical protein [Polyangiaceae bacterium]